MDGDDEFLLRTLVCVRAMHVCGCVYLEERERCDLFLSGLSSFTGVDDVTNRKIRLRAVKNTRLRETSMYPYVRRMYRLDWLQV